MSHVQTVDEHYYGITRTEVVSFLTQPVPAKVLEIGCGTGATLAALKKMGSRHVCGVELFEAAAAKARAREGVDEVLVGNAQTHLSTFKDGSFDLVVASHVLEHLVDPWQAAKDIHRVLAPNGMLIGAIPNVRHMSVVVPLVFGGKWRYRPSGILDRTHLRFFTDEGIRTMLSDAGFSDIEIRPDVQGALSKTLHRLSFGKMHGLAASAYVFRGIRRG
jgi:2-polyprenyl-3-methyl-5-hydroxy-6-metoxy-1,4-benzoquinol methylase